MNYELKQKNYKRILDPVSLAKPSEKSYCPSFTRTLPSVTNFSHWEPVYRYVFSQCLNSVVCYVHAYRIDLKIIEQKPTHHNYLSI